MATAEKAASEAGKSGYEKIYDWVAEELPGFDLAANAARLGLAKTEDGAVVVRLLGRDYRVDQSGAEPMDGRPAHFNRRSLAAHYAMSPGLGEPAMEFVKLALLSGTPVGGTWNTFNRESVTAPLVRRFEGDPEGLEAAVASLGGRLEAADERLGRSWIIPALPKIPLRLVYQPADEEFEAEFTVLYDRKGHEFMRFEALAFLGGALVDELLKWDPAASVAAD
jgi:hypothetical protein